MSDSSWEPRLAQLVAQPTAPASPPTTPAVDPDQVEVDQAHVDQVEVDQAHVDHVADELDAQQLGAPPWAVQEWTALGRALADLAARGEVTPCAVAPEDWTSNPERVPAALAGCARCSCTALCRAYAVAAGCESGVWGALHLTPLVPPPPPLPGERVPIDIRLARQLRAEGHTLAVVAARFGVTRQAVHAALKVRSPP